ncbi:hypothetical protein RCL_jg5278.t1 [Rhizophagus clarus]|uniref:Uncharacterized protein n=1 Tax=Rhizophagus clarus TaxID=94130 RepID=A0A8H3QQF6_9GLOM|nr:hypothetical protein RCL_jg5278.t1 [Rhizophagus clarus]
MRILLRHFCAWRVSGTKSISQRTIVQLYVVLIVEYGGMNLEHEHHHDLYWENITIKPPQTIFQTSILYISR